MTVILMFWLILAGCPSELRTKIVVCAGIIEAVLAALS